jgi:hypothetical protein
MILSYMLQIGLAILYGPPLLVDRFLISPFYPQHQPNPFSSWLGGYQELSLWSQLWFTVAMSLAGFVRQFQTTPGLYENMVVGYVNSIGAISFLLAVSAFYRQITRGVPLWIGLAAIITFAIYSATNGHQLSERLTPVLHLCSHIHGSHEFPSAHPRGAERESMIAYTLLVFALMGLWILHRWVLPPARPDRNPEMPSGIWLRYAKRVLGLLFFSVSLAVSGVAVNLLVALLKSRVAMSQISNNRTRENEWGVGQIIAPFAWGPLMVEMLYGSGWVWNRIRAAFLWGLRRGLRFAWRDSNHEANGIELLPREEGR